MYLIVRCLSGQVYSLEGKLLESLEILFARLAGPTEDTRLSPSVLPSLSGNTWGGRWGWEGAARGGGPRLG